MLLLVPSAERKISYGFRFAVTAGPDMVVGLPFSAAILSLGLRAVCIGFVKLLKMSQVKEIHVS